MVQRFIDDLRANGKNMRTGAKLSDKTVMHNLTFISAVMDYVVLQGMIPTNPCLDIRKPRVRTGHAAVSTTTNTYCHVFEEAQAKVSTAIASALDFSKYRNDRAGDKKNN